MHVSVPMHGPGAQLCLKKVGSFPLFRLLLRLVMQDNVRIDAVRRDIILENNNRRVTMAGLPVATAEILPLKAGALKTILNKNYALN